MTVTDIAIGLVRRCSEGDFKGAMDAYYSPDIVSIEPQGEQPISKGMEAVYGKLHWFDTNFEVHSARVGGPFIHNDQFAVEFDMDVTDRPSGRRIRMHEIGVYTVKDDKIVEERFFFAPD